MKQFKKYIALLIIPLCMGLLSCSDDDKVDDANSPDETILYEMDILNAGLAGDSTVIGVVDPFKKSVNFPRLHVNTDLSAIRFRTKLSNGAVLNQDTYDCTMPEGESEFSKVITVVNNKRRSEYFAIIRWDVPLFGANFNEELNKYDYSSAEGSLGRYPASQGLYTRSADFDGEYVLIVSRYDIATALGATSPHVLKLEDIKNGISDNRMPLSLKDADGQTIVSGGTFVVSAGRQIQGRSYISNMTTATPTSPLKVYYWETPTSPARLLYSNGTINPTLTGRYGDTMSLSLDNEGNGFIFFENNVSNKVLRVEIANFDTVVSETEIYPKGQTGAAAGQFGSYNWVEGTPFYVYTGHESDIMLVDESGGLVTKITFDDKLITKRACDARVIFYNEERYLLYVTANRDASKDPSSTIYVFDLTRGETLKEAFERLDDRRPKPLFSTTLGGTATTAPSTNSNYAVIDGNLYIFGASPDAGFAIYEFSKKLD